MVCVSLAAAASCTPPSASPPWPSSPARWLYGRQPSCSELPFSWGGDRRASRGTAPTQKGKKSSPPSTVPIKHTGLTPSLFPQSDLRGHHLRHWRAGRGQRRAAESEAEDEDAASGPAGLRHWTAPLSTLPVPGHCVRPDQHHRHICECRLRALPVTWFKLYSTLCLQTLGLF